MTPKESLSCLLNGNKRFVADRPEHPHCTCDHALAVATAQHPFAVVLTCADSRVPPALIFDQGIGDLFVIRVAGNVTDDMILASVEYAVDHLNTPLVMVLGHTNCGAVTAAANGLDGCGHLPALLQELQPAIAEAAAQEGDLIPQAIRINAIRTAQSICRDSSVIAEHLDAGHVEVVAALYDLATRKVELLED